VGTSEVNQRNPWSGYGILLKDATKDSHAPAAWYLSTNSGSGDWDRLLATFVELNEKGKKGTVQYLAGKMNYEALRALPYSFQASMLMMMSYAGADLAVFQTLHRYIADHPEMVAPALTHLLFPTRHWQEIVENSKDADPILVKALIRQESAFNPQARSRAKASGLMQLIYPTARRFGIPRPSLLVKPDQNIHAGSQFLAQLIEQFGSVELALAAYNAGPAVVRQWQKRYQTDNIDLFVEMIPYSETREYVRLVRRNFRVYESILSRPQLLGETRTPASTP
jgi:soluble lytic murein transglycosylase